MTETAAAKPMRADALRNRERLLAAAKKLFSEGNDASLEDVAKTAGVGVGTVYRHFPTRSDLVEAVYRSGVAALATAADELAGELPADEALVEWTDRFIAFAATKRGMSEALGALIASGSDIKEGSREQMIGAMRTLLKAGAADGTLRRDVDAESVMGALGGIFLSTESPDQAGKIAALVTDGVRTQRDG
jgi:AcrR family transcriptional regulator